MLLQFLSPWKVSIANFSETQISSFPSLYSGPVKGIQEAGDLGQAMSALTGRLLREI